MADRVVPITAAVPAVDDVSPDDFHLVVATVFMVVRKRDVRDEREFDANTIARATVEEILFDTADQNGLLPRPTHTGNLQYAAPVTLVQVTGIDEAAQHGFLTLSPTWRAVRYR